MVLGDTTEVRGRREPTGGSPRSLSKAAGLDGVWRWSVGAARRSRTRCRALPPAPSPRGTSQPNDTSRVHGRRHPQALAGHVTDHAPVQPLDCGEKPVALGSALEELLYAGARERAAVLSAEVHPLARLAIMRDQGAALLGSARVREQEAEHDRPTRPRRRNGRMSRTRDLATHPAVRRLRVAVYPSTFSISEVRHTPRD